MSVRKKFKAIMAGKRLVLMPGAYDALSARIMEAEGFEAICAGGYAAIGSMLAQADMGQSNMRDYADHYARMAAAVEVPVYVDADTGFGGVNNVRQMVRAFEAAGLAGVFISDQVFPKSLRLSAGQAGDPGRADAGQDQGRARCAPRPGFLHCRAHRRRGRRGHQCRNRAQPAFHGSRRRHGEADGRRYHRGHQARHARGRRPAYGDAVAGGRHEEAQPRRARSRRRRRRDVSLDCAVCRRATRFATCCAFSSARIRSRRRSTICCRSRIITSWSG